MSERTRASSESAGGDHDRSPRSAAPDGATEAPLLAPAPSGPGAGLLRLQSAAGNSAVARAVQREETAGGGSWWDRTVGNYKKQNDIKDDPNQSTYDKYKQWNDAATGRTQMAKMNSSVEGFLDNGAAKAEQSGNSWIDAHTDKDSWWRTAGHGLTAVNRGVSDFGTGAIMGGLAAGEGMLNTVAHPLDAAMGVGEMAVGQLKPMGNLAGNLVSVATGDKTLSDTGKDYLKDTGETPAAKMIDPFVKDIAGDKDKKINGQQDQGGHYAKAIGRAFGMLGVGAAGGELGELGAGEAPAAGGIPKAVVEPPVGAPIPEAAPLPVPEAAPVPVPESAPVPAPESAPPPSSAAPTPPSSVEPLPSSAEPPPPSTVPPSVAPDTVPTSNGPPTQMPPTEMPPTEMPPTEVPPTEVPSTKLPPPPKVPTFEPTPDFGLEGDTPPSSAPDTSPPSSGPKTEVGGPSGADMNPPATIDEGLTGGVKTTPNPPSGPFDPTAPLEPAPATTPQGSAQPPAPTQPGLGPSTVPGVGPEGPPLPEASTPPGIEDTGPISEPPAGLRNPPVGPDAPGFTPEPAPEPIPDSEPGLPAFKRAPDAPELPPDSRLDPPDSQVPTRVPRGEPFPGETVREPEVGPQPPREPIPDSEPGLPVFKRVPDAPDLPPDSRLDPPDSQVPTRVPRGEPFPGETVREPDFGPQPARNPSDPGIPDDEAATVRNPPVGPATPAGPYIPAYVKDLADQYADQPPMSLPKPWWNK